MNEQGICILFSILLVPVNFLCAFWLFREALQLTGMTYQEYFKKTSSANSAGGIRIVFSKRTAPIRRNPCTS